MQEESDTNHDSNLPITLTFKGKNFEIMTKGTIPTLLKELDLLTDFVAKVAEKIEPIGDEETVVSSDDEEISLSQEEVEKVSTAEIPSIKASKRTIENLEALFETPWGRTPRTLAEIIKALELNAIPDKVSSVNVYLRRLVRRGKLRRLQKEGKYVYFKLPE